MSMSQKERDTQDAITAAAKPFEDWEHDMAQTDSFAPRVLEDLIDLLITKGTITENDLPNTGGARGKYQNRKAIRASKP